MDRRTGELIEWNDDRGFGFIVTEGMPRLFVHAKQIRQRSTRPKVGDRLSFEIGTGQNGRPVAQAVDIAGANPPMPEALQRGAPERSFARESTRVFAAAILLVLVMTIVIVGRATPTLAGAYLLVGAASAFLYWWDKRAAREQRWRTSERILHALDLTFGIVGGLLAQHIFRHKTTKPDFIVTTWVIAAIHFAALALILSGLGPNLGEEQLRLSGTYG